MKLTLCLIISWALLFPRTALKAQLYEVSLDEKTNNSTLIVEGKVIAQSSFWNTAHTMIYTSNKIEIYKIFKGSQTVSTIEVVTQGGSVGNDYIEASDLLAFDRGDVGTIFCFPNSLKLRSPFSGNILFDVYSSRQGFLKYDLSANKAYTPFVEYNDIEGRLYRLLKENTGNNFKVVNASFRAIAPKKKQNAARTEATAAINSFSPATVNAGALNDPATNTLTINGSLFGAPAAGKQIVFKDANSANAITTFAVESTSPYIVSWTDNQIVLKVPTRAGTGRFGIVNAVADTAFSPVDLQVFYAVSNAAFFSGTVVSEPRLMNANGLGGYTILFSTNTAGNGTDITSDSAYQVLRRALGTWKEVTGVNFTEGGNTSNQVVNAADNVNTIMYDNGNTGVATIPSGTLAITYSSYTLCGGAIYSQKTGFDMVIRKEGVSGTPASLPFNKSYCSLLVNTSDLESTVLHELGHAINLGHIYDPQEQTNSYLNRNPARLMHPTITLSIGRKALDQSAYAGALYSITPRSSTEYGTCLYTSEMKPTAAIVSPYNECPAIFPDTTIAPGSIVRMDLNHATSNKYSDPQFTAISTTGNTNGVGVPVTNNAYFAIKTRNSGDLVFNISNYTTNPAEARANCPSEGARIAVYRVNACPAGQAYPAPVYVTTFSTNVSRTINNLAANTHYLFYFDGLYSTKPVFDITFAGGTTLPLNLTDFYGEENKTINKLFIELGSSTADMRLIMERSTDGSTFSSLAPIPIQAQTTSRKYTYNDVSPNNGNNYYRLRIISADGTTQFSKIVLLRNSLAGQIIMYPNPVADLLFVNLSYLSQDRFTVTITDISGRKLYSRQTGPTLLTLPFKGVEKGSYFIRITDGRNNVIAVKKILAGGF